MLYLRISMKPRKKKLEKKERSQSSSPETITRWIRNDDHKSWYWLNISQFTTSRPLCDISKSLIATVC